MTYSFIIAALILSIAAFFGVQQKNRITTLETEWQTLWEKGQSYEIPDDPEVAYAPRRTGTRTVRAERREEIEQLSAELIVFMQEVREGRQNGGQDMVEAQKRGMALLNRMLDFSPAEVRVLVQLLKEDQTIDQKAKGELLMMSVMILSTEQPETALALILEMKDDFLGKESMGDHFIEQAIGQLAAQDPMAALEWMKEHKDEIGGITNDMRRQVLMSAAMQDLKMAFSLVDDLGFENNGSAFLTIGRTVTPENAADFIAGIQGVEGGDSQKALAVLARGEFIKDFGEATQWLEKANLEDKDLESFVSNLDYYEIKEDPGQWLSWAVAQKGVKSKEMLGRVIDRWTQEDYRAAGEWVNTLDQGRQRDRAALSYAQTLAQHEPAAAAVWAETLPDGQSRKNLLSNIHKYLLPKDPAAAKALAEKHGIQIEGN